MRVGTETSWADLRSIPAPPVDQRLLPNRPTASESSRHPARESQVAAAEWTPSFPRGESATYSRSAPVAAVGPQPLTAAQRALYVAPPTADFFANFQAGYKQLALATDRVDANDRRLAEQLQQTLGQAHTEHMELVNRFSIQYEPEKAAGTGPAATLQYAGILNRAYETGGYENPRQFLESLTPQELHVLQTQNQLADPIVSASLTDEGARNLLLPYGMAVDLDGDQIYERGAARTMAFPPFDAPDEFKTAWFQATEKLDVMAAGIYALPFLGRLTNLTIGSEASTAKAPANQLETYKQTVDDYLRMLDEYRGFLAEGQYERDKPFFENLSRLLS
jgi:hypothetical protein